VYICVLKLIAMNINYKLQGVNLLRNCRLDFTIINLILVRLLILYGQWDSVNQSVIGNSEVIALQDLKSAILNSIIVIFVMEF
jgi:hypothetical protein